MYRLLIVAAMIATPVFAQDKPPAPTLPKDITISFTEKELNDLVGLIDLGVKAAGIKAISVAVPVLAKIQGAAAAAKKPAAPPEEKK